MGHWPNREYIAIAMLTVRSYVTRDTSCRFLNKIRDRGGSDKKVEYPSRKLRDQLWRIKGQEQQLMTESWSAVADLIDYL